MERWVSRGCILSYYWILWIAVPGERRRIIDRISVVGKINLNGFLGPIVSE